MKSYSQLPTGADYGEIISDGLSTSRRWRRYQVARSAAQPAFEELPALGFLARRVAPGAVVYSPEQAAQEAVPLFTNAVPYFPHDMWPNETSGNQEAILGPIAAARVLDNMSEADFARLAQSHPWPMYCHYLQKTVPQAEVEMRHREAALLAQFHAILAAERPAVLESLRYLPGSADAILILRIHPDRPGDA